MALKGPNALHILRAVKLEAYQAFIDEKISFVEIDEWVAENAERWKIEPEKLKHWIIDAQQNELSRANLERPNHAAKTANLMGATLKRTLEVYIQALGAVRVKRLVDRNGKVVRDEDGKPMQHESPDWEPRLKAAECINKILGVYAPEKQELILPQLDEFTTRTEVELRRELEELRASQRDKDPAGVESAPRTSGLPLLDDGMHGHQGRAGRDQSIQTVPEESPVFPTHLVRSQ